MQALVDYVSDQEKAAFETLINEIEKRSGLLYTQAQKDFAQQFATDVDCNVLCNAIKNGTDTADETGLYQLFLNVNGIDCNSQYHAMTAYIRTLIAKMGLDQYEITLFYSNNHYGSVAAMCDLFKYIRFDLSSVQSFPNEQWPELAWVAVHELSHFYNRDSLKLQVIKSMCKKIKRSNPTIEKSLVEWQSWNEHKADIFFLDKRFERFSQTEKLKLLKQAKRTLIHLFQLAGTSEPGQIDWDELQNDRDKAHPHPLKRFAYLDHAEALLKDEIQQQKNARTTSFFLRGSQLPVESNGLLGKQEL
ncbi:hypothetical protein IPH25_01490 [bacterium]|nr:MAG: hypothetical protein IPG37_03620 [bacterium]QQR62100.1 MAG: hypothetical protein IPH25_01490 [bacterium]QQR63343.1 MAG: hypothetical protein IPH67_02630 [bacterium]